MSIRPRNPLSLADVLRDVLSEAYTNERSSSHISVQPSDELRGTFERAAREVSGRVGTGGTSTGGGTLEKAVTAVATHGGAGTKNQIPV